MKLLVSKSDALVTHLQVQPTCGQSRFDQVVPWLTHRHIAQATSVTGVLPISQIIQLTQAQVDYFHICLNVPETLRGRTLTANELAGCYAGCQQYKVYATTHTMATAQNWLVTRHQGLIELAQQTLPSITKTVSHLSLTDTNLFGVTIYGVLPLHLASQAIKLGAQVVVPLIDLTSAKQGQELTCEQLKPHFMGWHAISITTVGGD